MQTKNSITPIPFFSWVAIERLTPGIFQPRQNFDETKLNELASSIAQNGILQPLIITQNYEIIAGERRYRAANLVGLKEVPCMILDTINQDQALIAILENVQRQQMEPLEEALAYQRLTEEFSWTQQHIANLLGKSRTHVTNMLRLLRLSSDVLEALRRKQISYGHARVLVGMKNIQQMFYLNWIEKNNASVRQLEKKVQVDKKKIDNLSVDDNEHFTRALSEQIGAPVTLEIKTNGEGWLKFKFFNQDTLIGLLETLGLSYDNEIIN